MKKAFKNDFKAALRHNMKKYQGSKDEEHDIKLPAYILSDIKNKMHSFQYRGVIFRQKLIPVLVAVLCILLVVGSFAAVTLIINESKYDSRGIRATLGNEQSEQREVTESEAYKSAADALQTNLLLPKTLPTECQLESVKVGQTDVLFKYGAANEKLLDYKASKQEQSSIFFDTQQGNIVDEQVQNKRVKSIKLYEIVRDNTEEVWYTACWTTDLLTYSVDTNLPKSHLLDFVESLN